MKTVKIIFFTIASVLFLNTKTKAQSIKNYEAEWKKVDDLLQKKNLPKSALAEVNKIYILAKKEGQRAQVIKALVYKINLQQETREEAEAASIKEVEKEIIVHKEPAVSILKSLLATIYWQYLQNHRYQLYDRTQTVNFKKEDIGTWTLEDLHKTISSFFLQSLAQKAILKKINISAFDAIIVKGNMCILRPTLYDLLAHQALEYFTNDERNINKPSYSFEINDSMAFAPAAAFAAAKFATKDSLSLMNKALVIYQDLIQFHLKDAKPDALIDVDLERLNYVRNHATMQGKEELYKKALEQLIAAYNNRASVAQATFLLASFYENMASTYQPFSDTTHRFNRLKARELLENVVRDSSVKGEGWVNSYNLLQDINRPQSSIEIEKVSVPDQPFRVLVKYRNANIINFKIIQLDSALSEAFRNRYDEKYWTKIQSAPAIRTWQQNLPATNDLQQHSVEVKVDALPIGEYILVSSLSSFNEENASIGTVAFAISNISYVTQGNQFFILHRQTGQPLNNATIKALAQQYDYKTYKYSTVDYGTYKTDKNGFFQITTKKEDRNNNYQIDIRYNNDRLHLDDYFYGYYFTNDEPLTIEKKIFFFTDRSIYRPGQTVYFKGIAVNKSGHENSIAANFKNKYFLENANGEEIDSIDLTTNDFGSVWSHFILPKNTLNGSFRIHDEDDDNSVGFSVEEYKRPKFYANFEKIKGTYKVGDSITVKGTAKAYAGNNITAAKVIYRVVRQPRFLYPWLYWRWMPAAPPMEITHGETTTDASGKFSVTFKAIPDESILKSADAVFDFHIYADVTDINGETRSTDETVSAGYKSLVLKTNIGERILLDSFQKISIRTENMSGEFEKAKVTVKFISLVPEPRLIRKRYWEQPDQYVMSKEEYVQHFPHDEYAAESDFKTWLRGATVYERTDSTQPSGAFMLNNQKINAGFYVLEITTKDKENNDVKDVRYFELYPSNNNNFLKPEYLWAAANSQPFEPGEKATIKIGSAAKDVFLVQQLVKNQTIKTDPTFSFFTLNNEKKIIEFPISESDRGGFGATYFFVKENRVYQWTNNIMVPWTNKELKIEYATFRDKTLPGSEEKWKVKISGYKGDQVAAEMLASMYDASLDQFKPHSWSLPNIWPDFARASYWSGSQNFIAVPSQEKWMPAGERFFEKIYDRLSFDITGNRREMLRARASGAVNDFAMNEVMVSDSTATLKRSLSGSVAGVTIRGNTSLNQSNALFIVDGVPVSNAGNLAPGDILNISVLKDGEATALYGAQGANGVVIITTKKGAPPTQVAIRKNFNETAFFFPNLSTDKDGSIEFSFTTPEALTRWKLQTLAHTKDLSFGYAQKEVVTQKELMVQPNMPRFLRQGDRMEISVKVVNLSDKEITGQVQLELLDATTNQSVDGWFQNVFPNQYFTVAAGSSEAVPFPIEVPFQFTNALTWRVTARAGNVSDGEEQLLPVLSNKILVTETLPLPMRGSGTKNFVLKNLVESQGSESIQHQSLTIEFTSNPAWYAIQALPYLMEFPYECSEQTWNRYYANALAAHIVNSAPRVKQIFESWKDKDTAALLSNLEKNTELKSVILEETPWVLAAQSESARKKNIALLFDLVRMESELKTNAQKLKELQSENGGFVWFKGGPDDRFITQYILTGIGHLQKITGSKWEDQKDLQSIISTAISYLDQKIKKDYEELKKSKADLRKQMLPSLTVQYLYMRSFFSKIPIPKEVQPAYDYYLIQAKQFWTTESKYLQGMTALVLQLNGDAITAKAIVKSLKETAITNEEQGMYWKENTFGRSPFWHQAPIETQALLIEAFSEISKDADAINNLKTWLLKNKQTNNWPTTKATADACYALLLAGSDWLQHEPEVEIKLGNTVVDSKNEKEQGTGYFKQTIKGDKVQPEMGNITVTTKNNGGQNGITSPAWGAVYWQYFEDMNKVKAANTPLQLSKKLFVEKITDRGPVLEPVEEGSHLVAGNKIKVRIILKVDREMEYLHMKDMRAAALEPVTVLSGYKWQEGLGYYQSTRDASTDFFFNYLPKGTYVFEYALFVTHAGTFSNGITTIQCMYAPEFSAHSTGSKITVE